jgi:SAM-dependent methyltransferase
MKALELRRYTMKPILRNLLRPVVSPRVFQSFRFRWWCLSSYFPRVVVSRFVKRKLQVRNFGAAQVSSPLEKQLQSVNALAPTRMCRVMTKYGSDKARMHKYTAVYSALFKERYEERLRVFELGLGTNNADAPSNMGVFGVPGASLRGWRELFPHALIFGADVDRRILFQEDRIKTYYCDQLDPSSIQELWSHMDLQGGADIIIEDGLHTLEANVSFLERSLDRLRPGGVYITEDISRDHVNDWYERLENTYSQRYPTYEFAFVVLPDRGNQDHNMLVIRRNAE